MSTEVNQAVPTPPAKPDAEPGESVPGQSSVDALMSADGVQTRPQLIAEQVPASSSQSVFADTNAPDEENELGSRPTVLHTGHAGVDAVLAEIGYVSELPPQDQLRQLTTAHEALHSILTESSRNID